MNNIRDSKLISRLAAIACMFIILIVIFSLRSYPEIAERYYSNVFYTFVRSGFLFLFNYIPFSVGDILYIIIIVLLIVGISRFTKFLIRRQFAQAGFIFLGFILKLQIGVALFYGLWALNYFRQPAQKRLNLPNYDYSAPELKRVTSMLIDSANGSRASLKATDLNVKNKQIVNPAIDAVTGLSTFDPPLIAIKPLAKSSFISPLLNYLGTAGYYNPFTGEAQFNNLMPVYTQPFVACHEMAHQMGFGAEDEANFAGFIAGKSSDNNLLKYSAYYLASQEFMNEILRTDSILFRQLQDRISPAVMQDLETEREFWRKYQGTANRLSSIFYDSYLKVNKQPEGLKTYNRMIKLSMSYYKKTGFIK